MSNGSGTNKYKTLAKDTGLFAISSFGSKILFFFLTPLYTYVLATEEFGIVDLINTTIQFIYPVLTLAISEATLRFAFDKEKNKNKVLGTSLFFVFIAVVVLCLLSPLFAKMDTSMKDYWGVFVLTFALFNIHICFSNFIKGIGKTKLFAVQGLVQTFSIIICNILLLIVFKLGVIGYLISMIVGHVVPIFVSCFGAKLYRYIKPSKPDFKLIKEMLSYSIPMIPTILAWSVNTSIDKYMIIGMLGLSESGIYSVAHKIPTIVTTFVSVFVNAWQLSAISNHGESGESEYYTNVYACMNIVLLLGCMLLVLLSRFICSILFAESYFSAWKCVPLLSISAIFSSHAGFLAAAFRADKKTKNLFASVFAGAVVNVVLNYFLIQIYGNIGAAIATAVSFGVVWVVRLFTVQKIVKVKINVISTVISYVLLFVSAFAVTFEVSFGYLVATASLLLIVAVNVKDIKIILRGLKAAFSKYKRASAGE